MASALCLPGGNQWLGQMQTEFLKKCNTHTQCCCNLLHSPPAGVLHKLAILELEGTLVVGPRGEVHNSGTTGHGGGEEVGEQEWTCTSASGPTEIAVTSNILACQEMMNGWAPLPQDRPQECVLFCQRLVTLSGVTTQNNTKKWVVNLKWGTSSFQVSGRLAKQATMVRHVEVLLVVCGVCMGGGGGTRTPACVHASEGQS